MLLRLDQSVQELSAISSQSCQTSDCHCWKMLHRLDQICELQWQSEERQIWLSMAGSSCTGCSNLRYSGRIYDFRQYIFFLYMNWRLTINHLFFAEQLVSTGALSLTNWGGVSAMEPIPTTRASALLHRCCTRHQAESQDWPTKEDNEK